MIDTNVGTALPLRLHRRRQELHLRHLHRQLPLPHRPCHDGGSATEVAIDRSGGPADGDIYVAEGINDVVDVFSNNGAVVGTLDGSTTPNDFYSEACGVAVDQSTGDLYVGDYGTSVWRYTPSSGHLTNADYDAGITTSFNPCQVAANNGKVYAANWDSGGPVNRYKASDFAPGAPAASGTQIDATATALSTDPQNGDLYVDEGDQVSVFDSFGALKYSFGSSSDFGTDSAGVAVKGSRAYVADRTNGEIDVFAASAGATPPTAITNPATTVSHTSATLNGHLDPASDPAITDCHFEWGTDTSYTGGTVPCTQGNSFSSAADVSASLPGLLPGTTYHYRLDITGSVSGDVQGADRNFTTAAFSVTSNAATAIHHSFATLNGHLDPQGEAGLNITECHFDWGTTNAYAGGTVPCAQGNSFSSAADVSASLPGLTPGDTYHFRLHVTTASAGQFIGADKSFAALAYPLTTDPATTIHHTDAVLNGHLDPDGEAALNVTECHFEWGTDNTYAGGTLPCAQGNSFSSAADVSALLNNLLPGVSYHYRLHIDTASVGEFTGADRTVSPPPFPSGPPANVASFGSDGTSATAFSSGNPYGLSFNQADRKLYALDGGVPGIYGFDASAPPSYPALSGFAPLSTVAIGSTFSSQAVDSSSLPSAGRVYLAAAGTQKIYGFDSSGAPLGGNFPIDPASTPGGPVGSPTFICGTAVDSCRRPLGCQPPDRPNPPLQLRRRLPKLGRRLRPARGGLGPCQIAFDSGDNLYVAFYAGHVWKYTAASGYYLGQPSIRGHRSGIAVDPATGDFYSSQRSKPVKTATTPPATSSATSPRHRRRTSGVTVDATSHYVYVADIRPSQDPRLRPRRRPEAAHHHPRRPHRDHRRLGDPQRQGRPRELRGHRLPLRLGHRPPPTATPPPAPPIPARAQATSPSTPTSRASNGGTTYHFRIVAANAHDRRHRHRRRSDLRHHRPGGHRRERRSHLRHRRHPARLGQPRRARTPPTTSSTSPTPTSGPTADATRTASRPPARSAPATSPLRSPSASAASRPATTLPLPPRRHQLRRRRPWHRRHLHHLLLAAGLRGDLPQRHLRNEAPAPASPTAAPTSRLPRSTSTAATSPTTSTSSRPPPPAIASPSPSPPACRPRAAARACPASSPRAPVAAGARTASFPPGPPAA